MRAFHNDPAVKAKYVARLAEHRRLEHLAQGVGYENDGEIKGCAVGCTLENYDHALYPIELGLPEWVAWLEDRIFEGLPKGEAEQFAEDFLAVIPVGADVSQVRGQLAVLRLSLLLPPLALNKETYARECEVAIKGVTAWHQGGEQEAARSAARRAARSAAAAAAAAAAAVLSTKWAEWAAGCSAARSAEAAEWAAAAHYEWEAENLLRLLAACPQGEPE